MMGIKKCRLEKKSGSCILKKQAVHITPSFNSDKSAHSTHSAIGPLSYFYFVSDFKSHIISSLASFKSSLSSFIFFCSVVLFSMIFISLTFLSLLSLASVQASAVSGGVEIVEVPRPLINITFDEPISSVAAVLKQGTVQVPLESIPSGDTKKFIYRPVNDLINGKEYTFRIIAYDAGGKPGIEQTVNFIVQVPPVKISLYNPRHGISPSAAFDLKFSTDRQAIECRYASQYTPYDIMTLKLKTEDSQTIHTLAGVNIPEGGSATYFVACKDSYGMIGGPSQTPFVITVDTTNPVILTAKAVPAQILSITANGLETEFQTTTNEPTICRASKQTNDYWAMEKFFAGYDAYNPNVYSASNRRITTGQTDGDNGNFADGMNYSFSVACENLAGLVSNTAQIDFSVDLTKVLAVTNVMPGNTVKTQYSKVDLTVETNKNSNCFYGPDADFAASQIYSLLGQDTRNHALTVGTKSSGITLTEGSNALYVYCSYYNEKVLAYINIIYDKTEPSMEYVNISSANGTAVEAQWQTDEMYAVIGATDIESGIDEYNYTLLSSGDKFVRNGVLSAATGNSDKLKISELNLSDGESYLLSVKAKNGAGIWGDAMESETVLIDVSLKPKETIKCTNGILDYEIGETDVDCGGELCNSCRENKQCKADNDCLSGLVCSENICRKETDCGTDKGEKCEEGLPCLQNNDCISGMCSNGLCEPAGCYDTIKNGDETAADCGGSCDKCGKGVPCLIDDDCATNACIENEDGEKLCAGKKDGEDCRLDIECESEFCDKTNNQCAFDSDKDGLPDWWEEKYFQDATAAVPSEDTDADGFTNIQEYTDGTDPNDPESFRKKQCSSNSDCSVDFICDIQNSCAKDTDGNGLPDWWEKKYFGCIDCVKPEEDNDGDGLSNLEEYTHSTAPDTADTDSDGYNDGTEIEAGTDPLDPGSHPASRLGLMIFIILALLVLGIGGFFAYKYYLKDRFFKKEIPQDEFGFPMDYGTTSTVQANKAPALPKKPAVDFHKVFVEKQKTKNQKMSSVFDAFGEDADKSAKKTGTATRARAFGEKEETTANEIVEINKPIVSKEKIAEKSGKSSALFDRLSSISKKEQPSKMGRLAELSKKKSGSLEKLNSKQTSKSRLDTIAKGKKSSLSELTKKTKKSGSSIEDLKKRAKK